MARSKITSHFKRRCIQPDCVTKTHEYLDIPKLPVFSFLQFANRTLLKKNIY